MDGEEAASYTGRLLGKPTAQPSCAQEVHLPIEAMFAHGLEYQCVKYEKGMYLLLSNERAVRVQGGVSTDKVLFLLVTSGAKLEKGNSTLPNWIFDSKLKLLPLKNLIGVQPMHLQRENSKGMTLLR